MRHELIGEEASLASGARRMQEAADLFGDQVDALLTALDHGGRSPWGDGALGSGLDQIKEALAQACRHLHTNLYETSAGIQTMGARTHVTEDDNTALIGGLGLETPVAGQDPTDTRRREAGRAGELSNVRDGGATA